MSISSTPYASLQFCGTRHSNAILTEPLKNSEGTEILRGYAKLHTYLVHKGFRPHTPWLDNEASTALKQFDTNNHI